MDYIERFHVGDFFCIRELDIPLTPMHAFIGPNDSGKSTILRAVRTLLTFGGSSFVLKGSGEWAPFDPGILDKDRPFYLSLSTTTGDGIEYRYSLGRNKKLGEYELLSEEKREGSQRESVGIYSSVAPFPEELVAGIRVGSAGDFKTPFGRYIKRGARFIQAHPDDLRRPSQIATDPLGLGLISEGGEGLAAIYDAVMNRGDESISEIREMVRKLFPTIKSVGLKVVGQGKKELQAELKTGERVPAQYLSEGLLYYILFASLKFLDPAAALLVEEPENGLHPARIADVMRVLREISRETQVLIATHSPLVINELEPEEVSLVVRPLNGGTKVIPMTRTASFQERSKFYALGELWLNYANGVDEKELLADPEGEGQT